MTFRKNPDDSGTHINLDVWMGASVTVDPSTYRLDRESPSTATIKIIPGESDGSVREDILRALTSERSDLSRKARLGALSSTDSMMLGEVNKAIVRLQEAEVERLRASDANIWERLEQFVSKNGLLPDEDK
jgi:hypothetical protein